MIRFLILLTWLLCQPIIYCDQGISTSEKCLIHKKTTLCSQAALALCKSGKVLVVANKEASSIVLIDTHTMEMIGQPIDVGEMPISICSYEHENGDINIYI